MTFSSLSVPQSSRFEWAATVLLAALASLHFSGPATAPGRALKPSLPFVDIVVLVPSPWKWDARRLYVFDAFLGTAARAAPRFTAKLIFVMGDDAVPATLSPTDARIAAHPSVLFVTAPACPDLDTHWPGASDGAMFPPANSSTTCKVLEGAAVAVEKFRFKYFARAGDDAYLRWDYFLAERAGAYPSEHLYLGLESGRQGVFKHLFDTFGVGFFLPYMTGQGWILTHDVTSALRDGYRRSPRLTTAGPEDAAIALHLFPFDVTTVSSVDFHDPSTHACNREDILVHYVTDAMVRNNKTQYVV
jgi:hypothetical protein